MRRAELIAQIQTKKSFLCVGLDSDISRIPKHLLGEQDPVFSFNKAIIEATAKYCVAYKINTAFYEEVGKKGWECMEKTLELIPSNILQIADAKRGDIGNTSSMYAKAFFETLKFDAITIAPYMGKDSIQPFLDYKDKWTIILGLTSNSGAEDFEMQRLESGEFLYEKVIATASQWGNDGNTMFVTGATRAEELANIRRIIPSHFLLVPGVGAQGGSLSEVYKFGANSDIGLLVNASRSIIFASDKEDFAEAATKEAMAMQEEMETLMSITA